MSDEPKIDELRAELESANERIKVLLGDRDKARRLLAEHADCDDPHCAAEIALALGRPETAPAAPSEPVPDGPRVWAMPNDVRKLSDRYGVVWEWAGGPYFTSGEDGGDEETIETLMTRRGPLTEVVEEATP